MLRTVLCDLLALDYPVIQGGMAWAATASLAAAVSEAGGLGIIGAGGAPPEFVREEIREVRTRTTRPFGVNLYFMSPFVDQVMEVVCQERVPVVTTGAGNPGKYMARLKEAGIKVIPVVSSVALARRLSRLGVDAFIAEGMESGGHVGELTTMALVPQVVDAVEQPVIAAGGVADGRGLAAALSLGAVGVQMGTRFLCARECQVHENYKQAIINAKDRDTVVTGTPGHQVRVLYNKLAREYQRLMRENASEEELDRLGEGRLRAAVVEGDTDFGSLMSGQVAAMVDRVQPAAVIISEVVTQAEQVLERLGQIVAPGGSPGGKTGA